MNRRPAARIVGVLVIALVAVVPGGSLRAQGATWAFEETFDGVRPGAPSLGLRPSAFKVRQRF